MLDCQLFYDLRAPSCSVCKYVALSSCAVALCFCCVCAVILHGIYFCNHHFQLMSSKHATFCALSSGKALGATIGSVEYRIHTYLPASFA